MNTMAEESTGSVDRDPVTRQNPYENVLEEMKIEIRDPIGMNLIFKRLTRGINKSIRSKTTFEAQMFDINAQRQKDTSGKYKGNLETALTHATDNINKSKVEKMDLQQQVTDSNFIQ